MAQSLEILVIDDEELIRTLLRRILQTQNVSVGLAKDGREGINMYEARLPSNPYDAVFTDLNMPNMSGAEVTKRVKKLSPTTPVYVITGTEPTEEYDRLRNDLKDLGPDRVIGKPFARDTITQLVKEIRLMKYSAKNK